VNRNFAPIKATKYMFAPKFTLHGNFAILFCFIFLFKSPVYAQLTVNPNQTAAVLSAALAGPGITVSSPVLTCAGVANGTFTVAPGTILSTGTTLFGISSGILLTTGQSVQASGPEPFLASTNNGTPGDPTLTVLAGATTYDACILEFDFTAVGDTVKFNYQFGTEEFNHSTCGPYNDAFAFFISGPGIVGTQNMALVPGTTIPVTVNSVNSGIPGPGYTLANCTIMGPGSPFTAYYADNLGGASFTYRGFTTKLTAFSKVIPCSTYHLKLTIADAGNRIYDSGVFIEAGSLSAPTISGIPSVCVGNTTTLSDPVPGGSWSSSSIAVATVGSSTGVVTGVSAGTSTITYTFGIGCFVTTPVTVTPAPTVISGVSSICSGAITSLTDAVPGGIWTSVNTAVATVNPTTGVVTSVVAGTAMIIYSLGTGCSVNTTITVNPIPAPITGTAIVCSGNTITLSDPTPGGVWTSSTPAVATIGASTGVLTGMSSGTTMISYTRSGCPATTIVTVKSISTTTLNAAICPGQSYLFGGVTYTAAGSYSHTFTTLVCDSIVTLNLVVNPVSDTIINAIICQGQSYTIGSNFYTTSGTYVSHATNRYGCDSAITLHLVVTPQPPAPTVVSPVSYCQDKLSVQLSATGSNLRWYTSNPGDPGSKVVPIPSTSVPGTFWYYVTQSTGSCESPRAPIQVTVYPTPVAAISYSRQILCQGDTISLWAAGEANVSSLWTFPVGASVIQGATTGIGPLIVEFDSVGFQQIKLTVTTNGVLCTSMDNVKVDVIDVPEVSFYSKHDVCIGDTVTLAVSAATPGVTKYVWDFGNATIITATDAVVGGPYGVTWTDSGIHLVQMYGMVGGMCKSKTMTDTIEVHNLPEAKIADINVSNICMGDSLWLSAVDDVPENKYTWAPAHFFDNLNRPGIYGRIEFAGNITLTVTSPFGCNAMDQVYINAKSCCNVAFPNAFTPNGDGKNDLFRPITAGHHAVHIFRVDNRWGQTVFETTNERDGWNGRFNGVPQDMGVYFYYFKYDCNGQTIEEKGDVTLIR